MGWDVIMSYATGVGTMISLIFSGWAALAASRAAGAANRQAALTSKQLISDQRAWLSLDLEVDGDLEFYETGASCNINVIVTNCGKTPALESVTTVKLTAKLDGIPTYIRQFSSDCRIDESYASRLVMPGEIYIRPWGATIEADEYDDREMGVMVAVICSTYKIMHDEGYHQTVRTFILGTYGGLNSFRPGSLISRADVRVQHWGACFAT